MQLASTPFQELRLDRMSRAFGTVNALSDITLSIRKGEFIALLGPSGCGKSTALNCIAGLLATTGGGIYIAGYYSVLTVNNSTISNNTAYRRSGGGVATTDSAITITQSSVTGNSAGEDGGGVYIHTDNYNALTITASTLSGNTADNSGGGVYVEHGPASFSNSTFANNSAGYGGGLHVHSDDYGTSPLTNSTVSGNSARSSGGGVVSYDETKLVITNTAIGGNSAPTGPDVYSEGGYAVESAFSLVGNTADATITDNGGNLLKQRLADAQAAKLGLDKEIFQINTRTALPGGVIEEIECEPGRLAILLGNQAVIDRIRPKPVAQ